MNKKSKSSKGGLEESILNIEHQIVSNKNHSLNKSLETTLSIPQNTPQEELDDLLHTKSKIPIHYELPFKEAKKKFKENFFRKEVEKHGNISMLAKFLGVDRRSIHRAIKDFDLKPRNTQKQNIEYYQNLKSYKNFKELLERYHETQENDTWNMPEIQNSHSEPNKQIQNKPNIKKSTLEEMTWKQAKKDFEKRYLKHIIKTKDQNQSNKNLAKQIGLREETLSRKLKSLKLS